MQYQIKYQKPKLYWLVQLIFPGYDFSHHILTFYRTIYSKNLIPEWILAHELVHIKQQGSSLAQAILHCIHYRLSSKYRYQSELAGYRAEYQAIKYSSRSTFTEDWLNSYAKKLAGQLLQPVYGFKNTEENFNKIIKDIKA